MNPLTKKDLEAITNEFSHLIDTPYSPEFEWDADVGKMVSPLDFATFCNNAPDNQTCLINNLYQEANDTSDHLAQHIDQINAQRDPDCVIERDLKNLPNDILRNVALDAKDKLEDTEQ